MKLLGQDLIDVHMTVQNGGQNVLRCSFKHKAVTLSIDWSDIEH